LALVDYKKSKATGSSGRCFVKTDYGIHKLKNIIKNKVLKPGA
jgi:hypothetical protein